MNYYIYCKSSFLTIKLFLCFSSVKLMLLYFQYIQPKKGLFIDIDTGQAVGEHNGFHNWTIGQRCCLENYKDAFFTFKKDLETNNIFVVSK